jgi:hypothetical protein
MPWWDAFIKERAAESPLKKKKWPEGVNTRWPPYAKNLFGCRIDAYPFPATAEFFKGNHAINQGEQGKIAAQTHIGAGMDLGTQLTDQDITGPDNLAAKTLDTPALGITVATIPGTTACFFMSHCFFLYMVQTGVEAAGITDLCGDTLNFKGGEKLTMALLQGISLTTLLFKDNDFFAFVLLDDGGGNLGALNNGLAYFHGLAVSHHENIGELHDITNLAGEFFNPQTISRRNLILFAAGTNNCVHASPPKLKKLPCAGSTPRPRRDLVSLSSKLPAAAPSQTKR